MVMENKQYFLKSMLSTIKLHLKTSFQLISGLTLLKFAFIYVDINIPLNVSKA